MTNCCGTPASSNAVSRLSRPAELPRKSKLAGAKCRCHLHYALHGPNPPGSFSRRPLAVPEENDGIADSAQVALELAAALEAATCEYAIGGAIALGYWAQPRGTLDVDVTLFLPPSQPSQCVRLLQSIGCDLRASSAISSLQEHGYCEVTMLGHRLDVFLPTIDFYGHAKQRRKRVSLGDRSILVWDAETLCIFKMMFFRRKDLADIEQIMRVQGAALDRDWILNRLKEIYGARDPRISQWGELAHEIPA
jgi:hypothetical protein